MTSSDLVALPGGAQETAARRVGASYAVGPGQDARMTRVALVCAKFNGGITQRLLAGALDALEEASADKSNLAVAWVPGAFELPLAARQFAGSGATDAVVALGAVVKGDTAHFDFVAGQCAAGLQRVALDTGVPVAFGVLTTSTVEQALARSGPGADNKGREAARTALEMAALLSSVPR